MASDEQVLCLRTFPHSMGHAHDDFEAMIKTKLEQVLRLSTKI